MRYRVHLVAFCIATSACGDTINSTSPSTLIATTPSDATDACPAGGVSIEAGLDLNGNQVLDPDEITSRQDVCNGTNGTDGRDGNNGENGTNGTNGRDGTNGEDGENGGSGEDGENGGSGEDGEDGEDGVSMLIRTTELAPGDDDDCPSGGLLVEAGPDSDGNGALGDDEVLETAEICTPPGALTALTVLQIGDEDCPAGGVRIDSGADINANGVLEGDEMGQPEFVCNGGSPKLALRLFPYSGFNGGFDATSFVSSRVIQRITNGTLESAVTSIGARAAHSELDFANGETMFDISADVRLTGVTTTNAQPNMVARVAGEFYNMTYAEPANRIDDVFAWIAMENSRDIDVGLFRCGDDGCGSGTLLTATNLATNVDTSVFHNLRIQYDGDRLFTFTLDGTTSATIQGPPRVGPAGLDFRFLSTSVFPNTGIDGGISARFDNVRVAGVLYDTFDGPRIDRTRWWNGEASREIVGGALRIGLGADGDLDLGLTNPASYNAIAADVQFTEYKTTGEAVNLAYLAGSFYNDGTITEGAGPGLQTSDIGAVVGMNDTEAFFVVYREVGPQGGGDIEFLTNETTIEGFPAVSLGTFEAGTAHTLFMQWDGALFTFQLDGRLPATFDPVAAGAPVAQALANQPLIEAGLTTLSEGDDGYATVLIDNLRVGSRTLVGP